jgi:hypothetical protein
VPGPVALGDEPVERRAQRLLARAGEHLLGGGVEQHDALVVVDGDHRVHGGVEDAPQPRLAPRDHRRVAHAPRDVAQDHRVELVALLDVLRDRGLDRELGAVGAQRVEHRLPAHGARGHAGLPELAHVPRVGGAEALRDQHLDRLSDHRRARPAEGAFGGGVELHHALRLVHGDDRVHGRLDDAADPRLGLSKGVLGHAPLLALAV